MTRLGRLPSRAIDLETPSLSEFNRHRRENWPKLRRDLFRQQQRLCFYCRQPMTMKPQHQKDLHYVTFDHKEPVSRGGTDRPDNIVLACRQCNERKGDMTAAEFLAALAAAGVPGAAGRALAEAAREAVKPSGPAAAAEHGQTGANGMGDRKGDAMAATATAARTMVSSSVVAPGPVPAESAVRPPGTPADHPAADQPSADSPAAPAAPASSPLVVVGPAFLDLDPAPLDRLTFAQRRYVASARAIDRAGGRVRYSTVAAHLGVSRFAVRDMAARIRAIDPALWPWEMGRIKGSRGTRDAARPPGRPQEPVDAPTGPTDDLAPADASPPTLGGQTARLALAEAIADLQAAAVRPATADPLAGVAPAFRLDLAAQLAVARLVSGLDREVARRALAWVLSVMDEGEMGGTVGPADR
jgi:hypothetical protein